MKQKRNKNKNKKPFYKKKWVYLTTVPLLLIGSGGYYAWDKYGDELTSYLREGNIVASNITKDTLKSDKTTVIIDKNGKEIKKLNSQAELQVNQDNINPYIRDGFIAVEDSRFYKHNGVDPYGTLRSVVGMLAGGGVQGGSTITQQLVKNRVLENAEQTKKRKITEMVAAQELEKQFSKDEILIAYLNSAWFGHGATGVGAASKFYFNKDQKDLTPREAATIIGITNNPEIYDPLYNYNNSKKKTDVLLRKMYEEGVITLEEFNKSINEEVKITGTPLVNTKDYTDDYAVSFAIQKAAEEMAKVDGFEFKYKFKTDEEFKDYHQRYNQTIQQEIDKITSGGYRIETSIDINLQKEVESAINRVLSPYTDINEETEKLNLQVATTIIDNQTKEVAAIIGGRTTDKDYFNRAYQGYRQPGSTMKPIVAYAPAMMEGGLLPQTMISDTQVPEYPMVKDSFGGWYNKDFTARDSLSQSLNAPALRAAMMSDIGNTTNKLADMEFRNLHPYDENYIIALGGLTYGATTTEMASAYSTLVNQGEFTKATNVNKVINTYTNETIYENDKKSKQIYTPSSSYMTLDMMKSSAVGETITAKPALATNYPEKYQAAKTGTTDHYKDAYFVEATHYYSNAVWIGREDNENLNDSQQKLAMLVNGSIQQVLLKDKEPIDFKKPDSVEKSGQDFTVIKKEEVNNKSKSETHYKDIESKRRSEIVKVNKIRLDSEDYRIIYGLTKEDEKERELDVERKIKEIKDFNFDSLEKYEDIQTKISNTESSLLEVKNKKARSKFKKELDDIKSVTSEQLSNLRILEKYNKDFAKTSKIQEAEQNLANNNQTKIYNLESSIPQAKQKVIDTFKNKGDTSKAISELDSIIDQINSLGKSTPYYTIITDGDDVVFIEKESPEVYQNR